MPAHPASTALTLFGRHFKRTHLFTKGCLKPDAPAHQRLEWRRSLSVEMASSSLLFLGWGWRFGRMSRSRLGTTHSEMVSYDEDGVGWTDEAGEVNRE
jgi:hypothetical protein